MVSPDLLTIGSGLVLGFLLASILLFSLFRRKLGYLFSATAGEALQRNNRAFLDLAATHFKGLQLEASGDLERREQSLRLMLQPLQQTLERYDRQLRELERKREHAYGSLHQFLKDVASTQAELRHETGSLVQALRSPQVRGKWGEMSLRRVAELAGLVEHCDFDTQPLVRSHDSHTRPDLVVHLPNNRTIVVDSKVPLDSYIQSTDATNDARRKLLLKRHSQQLRQHIYLLSSKAYSEQLKTSPEFVVLYLPLESLYSSALREDPELIERASRRQVVLATPTTLIALLKAVAYGWRQEKMAQNTEEIANMAREFLERLATFHEHFSRLGTSLDRSVDCYNKTLASLERRVLAQARRLEEIGISPGKPLPENSWVRRRSRQPDKTLQT